MATIKISINGLEGIEAVVNGFKVKMDKDLLVAVFGPGGPPTDPFAADPNVIDGTWYETKPEPKQLPAPDQTTGEGERDAPTD